MLFRAGEEGAEAVGAEVIVKAVLFAPDVYEIEAFEAIEVMGDGGDAEAKQFGQFLPVARRGDEQLDERPARRVREQAVDILIGLRRYDLRHNNARFGRRSSTRRL